MASTPSREAIIICLRVHEQYCWGQQKYVDFQEETVLVYQNIFLYIVCVFFIYSVCI
jgi:hypothetical protein